MNQFDFLFVAILVFTSFTPTGYLSPPRAAGNQQALDTSGMEEEFSGSPRQKLS